MHNSSFFLFPKGGQGTMGPSRVPVAVASTRNAHVARTGAAQLGQHHLAQLAMNLICLEAFSQPCCEQKGKSGDSSFSFSASCMKKGTEWSQGLVQLPTHSIKTFQLVELEKNKPTDTDSLLNQRKEKGEGT